MDLLVFISATAFVILGLWVAGVMVAHYAPADRPVRFSSMLGRLGLSLEKVKITLYADHLPTAAYLCMRCKSGEACNRWLAGKAARVDPPEFCPNANFLKLLRKTADAV